MSTADHDISDTLGIGRRKVTAAPREQAEMQSVIETTSAIHAMIGYCQSLKVGTVISEAYMARMNDYYIPKLEAIVRQHHAEQDNMERLAPTDALLERCGLSPRSDPDCTLVDSIKAVSHSGVLPDGDVISVSVALWLEGLLKGYQREISVISTAKFWKDEYCSLARAGVERLAEYGIEVDPPERMIEAAEYREKKFLEHHAPARESVNHLKILEDECWDLRCVSSGDDDYCWQVVGHWMSSPQERVIGIGQRPTEAILDAMQPRDYEGKLLSEIESPETDPKAITRPHR